MGCNAVVRFLKYRGVMLLAVWMLAISMLAQGPTGSFLGTVKDTTGGLVTGATITIKNVDTGAVRTTVTGSDGSYNVPNLLTGHYELDAAASGFKTSTRTGLTLEVTQQAVINFDLDIGATSEKVVITAEAPIVNTQDATMGGMVNETEIKELPLNGRNYVDLSLLQPGVVEDKNFNTGGGFGTSFSSNGATVRSNNYTLDGAVLQSQFARGPASEGGTTLGVEGIKEYKVITNNFDAQYGLTMGSQMVMVSANGTNSFHGDAFYFMRNAALDAKQFFDATAKIPQFQKNNLGGSLGGPIRKDKTFFFGVFEGIRQNVGVTSVLNVPSAGCHGAANATLWNGVGTQPAGTTGPCPDLGNNPANPAQPYTVTIQPDVAPFLSLFSLPNLPPPSPGQPPQFTFPGTDRFNENYGQIRVDQNFSASDTLFGRYTIDDLAFNNVTTTIGASNTGSNYPYFGLAGASRNQYLTLGETHIFSNTVLNTARISFSRTNLLANDVFQNFPSGVPAGGPPIIPPGTQTVVGAPLTHPTGTIGITGYAGWSDSSSWPVQSNTQNIYTIADDINVTRGKHAFKFGVLLNRWNQGQIGSQGGNGSLSFSSLAQFLQSTPDSFNFQSLNSIVAVDYIYDTYGFYAQDDWRITPRLTANLGFRYEFMTTPHELDGNSAGIVNIATDAPRVGPPMSNQTLHDFSPRIGLAWDVFGTGKTAVRSGFGIYYDIGSVGTILQQLFVPPIAGKSNVALDGSTFFQIPVTAAVLNTPSGNVSPTMVDYKSKSPYLIQYNLSVEQQLPWNIGLTVAYAGSRGIHLFDLLEGNPIRPTSTSPCGNPMSLCVNGVVQFWDNGAANYVRGNHNIPSAVMISTPSQSYYSALEVGLVKRVSHGLEFQSAYTWSKVLDTTQGQAMGSDCTASTQQPTDPINSHIVDRGPACFDVTNVWSFNTLYHLPTIRSDNAFVSKGLNGWWVSTIVNVQGGYPWSPRLTTNRSLTGEFTSGADNVNLNTAASIAASPCTSLPGQPAAGSNPCAYTPIPFDPATAYTGNINSWVNPAMFSMSPAFVSPEGGGHFVGQLGTAGRDFLRGPNFRNWNFSLVKDTKLGFLGESGMLEFRTEIFNVLNHPNFAMPNRTFFTSTTKNSTLGPYSAVPRSTAGQITATRGNPRQIQFALKVAF